jgi:hypothetical protein
MEIITPRTMYFLVFSKKTVFFKLQDLFPECSFYREGCPQVEPLVCLKEENVCHVGCNCMETLARRLHMLFGEVFKPEDGEPSVDLIVLYFRKTPDGDSLGAGVFWRDFTNLRIITVNRAGWNYVKLRGNVFQFNPSDTFFLSGKAPPPTETTETASMD